MELTHRMCGSNRLKDIFYENPRGVTRLVHPPFAGRSRGILRQPFEQTLMKFNHSHHNYEEIFSVSVIRLTGRICVAAHGSLADGGGTWHDI